MKKHTHNYALFGDPDYRHRFDGVVSDDWSRRGACYVGGSSSKSSSSSQTATTVDTTNIGLEDISGLVSVGGGTVTNSTTNLSTVIDGGAFQTVNAAIAANKDILINVGNKIAEAQRNLTDKLFAFTTDTLDKTLDKNQAVIIDGILTAQQPDTEATKDIITTVSIAIVLSVLGFAFVRAQG